MAVSLIKLCSSNQYAENYGLAEITLVGPMKLQAFRALVAVLGVAALTLAASTQAGDGVDREWLLDWCDGTGRGEIRENEKKYRSCRQLLRQRFFVLRIETLTESLPVCIPEGTTFELVRQTLVAYLKPRPELQIRGTKALIIAAFEETWPCN